MQPFKNAKIEYSPSNVDQYERVFRRAHDIVMGYVPRPQPISMSGMHCIPYLHPFMHHSDNGSSITNKQGLIVLRNRPGFVPATSVLRSK